MPGEKRIVIADRSAFLRAVVARLCQNAGHRVVGDTSRIASLLTLIAHTGPDVVITDVDLDDGPIEPSLAQILRSGPGVVVVCAQAVPDRLTAVLAEGVSAYLLHDTAPLQLIEALHLGGGGGAVALHPSVAGTVVQQWRSLRRDAAGTIRSRLTPRELDVLAGMVEGMATKNIARRLGVALKTVENHKLRIFDKLGARTQAHAVGVALAHGLVPGVRVPE